jgi:FkbM family methyltransferase
VGLYKDFLVKISRNAFVQRQLAKHARALNHAMGIGSGGEFNDSGEFVVFDLLIQRCQPPYCIFDVGANKGQFLNYALERTSGKDCQIHCFEPGHDTFQMLMANSPPNPKIKLNNVGLGKDSTEKILYYNAYGAEGASLTKRDLAHYGIRFDLSEVVQIETLDHYCLINNIEHIHLLKLDIEGHELDALAGSREMIAKNAVDIILFEFGGCNVDTRRFFRDYWHFFQDTNMDVYRATPSGYLLKISKYSEEYEQFLSSNFVALARQ